MTVGELIEELTEFDSDMLVMLRRTPGDEYDCWQIQAVTVEEGVYVEGDDYPQDIVMLEPER